MAKLSEAEGLHTESHFLENFFSRLNECGIEYCVLRNYKTLPSSLGGSDLDILISVRDTEKANCILSRAIEYANGTAIGCSSTPAFIQVMSFGSDHGKDSNWWGVTIDLYVGYSYKGIIITRIESIGSFKTTFNDISVIRPDFAAILGVLKELLHNGDMPERYRVDAAMAVRDNWEELSEALKSLGEKGLSIFRELILNENNLKPKLAQLRSLRRAIFWNTFRRSPLSYTKARFLYEWAKVGRYLQPAGIIIAVLGVDGVGKSTLIRAIEPLLKETTHGALQVKHLRPGLLPPLARLKGQRAEKREQVLDPHCSKPSRLTGSLVRLIYYTMDYVLGYWLLLRPQIAKSPTVILFDRYCYDMALDPRRFRIGITWRVVEWFLRLIPKPDVIFCLYTEPAVILARKTELPRDEIARQVEAMKAFAQREPRAILVSSEDSVEEVRDRVLIALRDYCTNRRERELL